MTVIDLEVKIPGAAPEQVYELLSNGAKFGDVTGQPGKGGGAPGAYFSLFDGWLEDAKSSSSRASASPRRDGSPTGRPASTQWCGSRWPGGRRNKMLVHQDGVPADVHEHVRTNWRGFYFEPSFKHFAGLG